MLLYFDVVVTIIMLFSKVPKEYKSLIEDIEKDESLNQQLRLKNAELISQQDAIQHQWALIKRWEPKSDTRVFRYGTAFESLSAGMAGLYFQAHYRSVFKLGAYGFASTYLATTFLPVFMTGMFQNSQVRADIIIEKTPCLICLQVRSALIQTLLGTVYPLFLAPVAASFVASRYYTYPIPELKQYKSIIELWKDMTRPIMRHIGVFAAFQIAVASLVTYKEMEQIKVFKQKVWQREVEKEKAKENVDTQQVSCELS